MALSITSTAWPAGGEIPAKYTCEGRNVSPPLVFAGVPQAAESLVLIVDDPDAPDPRAPKICLCYWMRSAFRVPCEDVPPELLR